MRWFLHIATALVCGCSATRVPVAPPETMNGAATRDAAVMATSEQRTGAKSDVEHQGYHVIERNGTRFYCSDQAALGTRLKSRVTCLTEEQLYRARQDVQDKMREKQGQRLSHD